MSGFDYEDQEGVDLQKFFSRLNDIAQSLNGERDEKQGCGRDTEETLEKLAEIFGCTFDSSDFTREEMEALMKGKTCIQKIKEPAQICAEAELEGCKEGSKAEIRTLQKALEGFHRLSVLQSEKLEKLQEALDHEKEKREEAEKANAEISELKNDMQMLSEVNKTLLKRAEAAEEGNAELRNRVIVFCNAVQLIDPLQNKSDLKAAITSLQTQAKKICDQMKSAESLVD